MTSIIRNLIFGMLLFSVGITVNDVSAESSQNPCDDSYVKQAADELIIKVKPNGIDDTSNIQCALDWAVDTGMPQVRLSADTFYISHLVIEKFNGSLQGMTIDSTIIEVLDDSIACNALTSSGRSSAAIKFVMGEPRLRFMTIHAHRACQTNNPLQAIVRFTGAPAEVGVCRSDVVFGAVDRVILDGTSKTTGPLAAVSVSPEVHAASGCKNTLLGTFKLNRSMLANTQFGLVSQMKSAAQVDVNFNDFIGNESAIWLIDTNQSTTITLNDFFGGSTATDPYFGIMVASTALAPAATRVVVHKNKFNLSSETGKTSAGVLLQQPGKIVNISSVITNNQFLINGAGTWGVYALDVSRVHVSANSFSGTPSGAVVVAGSTPVTGWSITANNGLKNLVSSSLRDIWLRDNTSNCIVGPGQGALINNLGTNNSILTHFSPSPTEFRNKVGSVTPEKSDPVGGPIGDSGQYAEYVQAQQAELQVSARGPGTQETGRTPAMVEMLDTGPNPCNESFVSRDDDELLIKVAANGNNDTENIQCALDWAVDTGMPVVRLSADKFFISSVSIEKFNGSLQGNTLNSTTIEVLDGSIACNSMTQSGRASAAIRFVKGESRLRYMTIKAHRACKTSTRLGALVRFTGEPASPILCTNDVLFGSVDRVGVDGTSVIDGPLVGVSVSPEVSSCPGRLQGTFKFNRSFVAKTEFGVLTRMRSGAQVDINFNDFLSTQHAIWLIDTNQNTTITSNQFFGGSTAEKPFFGVMVASSADAPAVTRLVVHNNLFNISSAVRISVAVYQQQPGKVVNISSVITNNRFEIFGSTTWGIVATDVSKTHVSANRFSGTAVGAIQVSGTTPVTGWTITANNGFDDFTSTSTRDIWLHDNTSRCIVGPGQGVTVNNLGNQNAILSLFSPSETLLQNTVKSNPALWPGSEEVSLEFPGLLQ